MELPDLLTSYADPDIRDRLPNLPLEAASGLTQNRDKAAKRGADNPEAGRETV